MEGNKKGNKFNSMTAGKDQAENADEEIEEDIREEALELTDMCDDEFEMSNTGVDPESNEFDSIVECQQDILISDEFEKLQKNFIEKHCDMFEDVEENKHEYYTAFQQYKKIVEKYMDTKLKESLPDYTQKRFQKLLETREDQIDEQIIDTLTSFDDFMSFKEMMLERKLYKVSKDSTMSVRDDICFEKYLTDTQGYDNMDELEESLNVKSCFYK